MLKFRDVLQDPEVLSPSTESLLRGPKRSFYSGWSCPGWAWAAEVLRLHSPNALPYCAAGGGPSGGDVVHWFRRVGSRSEAIITPFWGCVGSSQTLPPMSLDELPWDQRRVTPNPIQGGLVFSADQSGHLPVDLQLHSTFTSWSVWDPPLSACALPRVGLGRGLAPCACPGHQPLEWCRPWRPRSANDRTP